MIFISLSLLLFGLTFGGEWIDASWNDYSFMARLDIVGSDGNNYICGGSIISMNEWNGKGVILTAAHCVSNAVNINVGIGCTHTNCNDAEAKWYDDHYYVIHPNYNPSLQPSNIYWSDNDLALIFLREEINNYNATKIELHSDISILENDANIRVFGYYGSCDGQPICVGGSDVDSLEYANTNFMITSECDDVYGESVTGPQDFCIRDDKWIDGRQGVCMGDSGSPLIYDGKQIGLNSWGPGNCDPKYPTVATSVPNYHRWIAAECPQCVGLEMDENTAFKTMTKISTSTEQELSTIECKCHCGVNTM